MSIPCIDEAGTRTTRLCQRGLPQPFALSLSKGVFRGTCFEKLSANGSALSPARDHAPTSSPSRAIFSVQTKGASWWTLLPSASTATVTGKSDTSNS